MSRPGSLCAILTVMTLLNTGTALSLRCGNDLVSNGDAKIDVLAKCGTPMLQTGWDEWQLESDASGRRRVTTRVEEWTYNFGPNDFLYYLRFENGRLTGERTGSYGSTSGATASTCRNGQLLAVGDSMAEVLLKCGEPVLKENREDRITAGDRSRRLSVVIDEWTYNFGPNHFLYFVTFENGRVAALRTGGYGY